MEQQKKIAIITDTTCDISDELLKQYSIYMVPLRIVFEKEEYRDRLGITPEKVYELLENEIPKSSLPIPDDIKNVLDEIISKGYTDIIFVTISSGLSGTNNMVRILVDEYQDKINIEVVDSLSLSLGLGFQVLECAKTVKETGSVSKALKRIKEVYSSMSAMYVVKSLEYLRKGGRIGKVEGTVGDFLNLKPIISINEEGVYYTVAKVRGRRKSIAKMVELFKEKYQDKAITLGIAQGMAKQEAEDLLVQLKAALNIKKEFMVQISPVLGMHTGPGLLGVIAYEQ
ncbi:MAG: DegV family protein [Clostridiales bacterium]|nr:DegV family protein [Clostridiales bacterium]